MPLRIWQEIQALPRAAALTGGSRRQGQTFGHSAPCREIPSAFAGAGILFIDYLIKLRVDLVHLLLELVPLFGNLLGIVLPRGFPPELGLGFIQLVVQLVFKLGDLAVVFGVELTQFASDFL